jgi:hypothetical protein
VRSPIGFLAAVLFYQSILSPAQRLVPASRKLACPANSSIRSAADSGDVVKDRSQLVVVPLWMRLHALERHRRYAVKHGNVGDLIDAHNCFPSSPAIFAINPRPLTQQTSLVYHCGAIGVVEKDCRL